MDLDVLMPFHREDTYLDEAIASLGSATGVKFRVIFIDDRVGRKKNVLKKFNEIKNYELLKTQGGEGYGEALRLGTAAIQSEVVALFNSDDLMHPERFKQQILCLEKSELCITRMMRIDSRGRKSRSLLGDIRSNSYNSKFLLLGSYGANASWCMRKDWWIKNSFFDSQECLDWRIALKSFDKTSISYISEPMYFYRKHRNQVTANRHIDRSRFDKVYNSWLEFALRCGLPESTREIFEVMALPWAGSYKSKYEQQCEWTRKLLLLPLEDRKIQDNLISLISRRMLIASYHSENSIKDRIKYFKKGFNELLPLAHDLFF